VSNYIWLCWNEYWCSVMIISGCHCEVFNAGGKVIVSLLFEYRLFIFTLFSVKFILLSVNFILLRNSSFWKFHSTLAMVSSGCWDSKKYEKNLLLVIFVAMHTFNFIHGTRSLKILSWPFWYSRTCKFHI